MLTFPPLANKNTMTGKGKLEFVQDSSPDSQGFGLTVLGIVQAT